MKNLFILLTFALIFSSQAFAAGVFGPAQPEGKAGEISVGTGYFYYNSEWDGDLRAEQNEGYVQVGYAITDKIGAYLMGGAADLDFGPFNDGFRPFGAVGVKWLITDRAPVGVGAFAQFAYFDDYESGGTTTRNNYEATGGVVLQTVIEGAYLYGGPLFFTREGSAYGTIKGHYEEQSNFGGMAGVRWPIKNNIVVDLETQYKTKLSVGTAIHFNF